MSAKRAVFDFGCFTFVLAFIFGCVSCGAGDIKRDYALSDSAGLEAPISIYQPVDISKILIAGMTFGAFSPRMLYSPESGTFYPAGAVHVSSPLTSVPAEKVTSMDKALFKDRAVLVTEAYHAHFPVIAEIMAEAGAKVVMFQVRSGKPKSSVLPDFRHYLGLYSIPMFQIFGPVDWYTCNMIAPIVTIETSTCESCNPRRGNPKVVMIFAYLSSGFAIITVIALIVFLRMVCVSGR